MHSSSSTRTALALLGLLLLLVARPYAVAQKQATPVSAFAKSNLHAWAFEEYDAVSRTPAERARVLKRLGLTKAGYVGRNVERMKEFDAYVAAYRDEGIELVAVWTPVNTDAPLEEEHLRMFLDAAQRHRLRVQWWVTLEHFKQVSDERGVDRAAALVRTLMSEADKRGLRLALYGHGRDSWFTQPENQLAILTRVAPRGSEQVGLVYNFHHAHSQLDRFATFVPQILPHLWAVNLNGMKADGPMILPVGQGDREREMIRILSVAGYRGSVGILHHQRTVDAEKGFTANIEGLRQVLTAIGDTAALATY
jgi:sugar phosphate isomerase/epimerase